MDGRIVSQRLGQIEPRRRRDGSSERWVSVGDRLRRHADCRLHQGNDYPRAVLAERGVTSTGPAPDPVADDPQHLTDLVAAALDHRLVHVGDVLRAGQRWRIVHVDHAVDEWPVERGLRIDETWRADELQVLSQVDDGRQSQVDHRRSGRSR